MTGLPPELERMLSDNPSLEHLRQIYEYITKSNDEFDLGKVITCSAYAEYFLERLLRTFLRSAKETDEIVKKIGPNFSSRVKFAYSMNLFAEQIKDQLLFVAEVRNEFAHNKDASFDDQGVGDICDRYRSLISDGGGERNLAIFINASTPALMSLCKSIEVVQTMRASTFPNSMK
jgi:hypothetical protein